MGLNCNLLFKVPNNPFTRCLTRMLFGVWLNVLLCQWSIELVLFVCGSLWDPSSVSVLFLCFLSFVFWGRGGPFGMIINWYKTYMLYNLFTNHFFQKSTGLHKRLTRHSTFKWLRKHLQKEPLKTWTVFVMLHWLQPWQPSRPSVHSPGA